MTQRAETRSEGGGLLPEGEQDLLQPVESVPEEATRWTAMRQLARSAVPLSALLSNQVRPAKAAQARSRSTRSGRVRRVRSS